MIKNLPSDARTPSDLEAYINKVAPVKGSIVDTQLFYATEKLNKKILAREDAVRNLEHAKVLISRSPSLRRLNTRRRGSYLTIKMDSLAFLETRTPLLNTGPNELKGRTLKLKISKKVSEQTNNIQQELPLSVSPLKSQLK